MYTRQKCQLALGLQKWNEIQCFKSGFIPSTEVAGFTSCFSKVSRQHFASVVCRQLLPLSPIYFTTCFSMSFFSGKNISQGTLLAANFLICFEINEAYFLCTDVHGWHTACVGMALLYSPITFISSKDYDICL